VEIVGGPDSLCNSVRIELRSCDAQRGQFGAAIGSGYSLFRKGTSQLKFFTIIDGNVTARGDYGSGIDSGYGEYGNSNVFNLTILNGISHQQIHVLVVLRLVQDMVIMAIRVYLILRDRMGISP
jgi:hypothetical protein